MKNTKGFTLIELLAVIVILAIIALIATPMILNVVNDAKESAAVASANGFIEAIDKNNVLAEFDEDHSDYTEIAGNAVYSLGTGGTNAALPNVPLKGDVPTSGWVYIDSDGTVAAAVLYFENISSTTTVRYLAGEKMATKTYATDDSDVNDSAVTTSNAVTTATTLVPVA